MRHALIALGLLAMAGMAHAQTPANCSLATAPRALPIQPTVLPALSPELTVPSHQLGAPTGVLAQAYDESQTLDNVLFRLKLEGCRSIANAAPAASPANGVIDPSTYKPQTQFDNTPWRFDMNQNGKRMTAEEFDQWMKARGVRVAKGGAPAAAPAPASSTAAPAPVTTTPAPAPEGTPPGTQAPPATPAKP
ncbi:putative secreted protein [Lysobacter dokdonensis DS-58]|uniref:Putative secreted protein n=1 Tax=Lysobacter dokdonensis DS-58 TaxID=1300345 RepID=A0A0A2WME2_9GAMM|nr:hypothetical protein [Lysobacter dokdonensis]KGQ19455.1 putative secreted protein [Lysobacter dokdonensis DS-58]